MATPDHSPRNSPTVLFIAPDPDRQLMYQTIAISERFGVELASDEHEWLAFANDARTKHPDAPSFYAARERATSLLRAFREQQASEHAAIEAHNAFVKATEKVIEEWRRNCSHWPAGTGQ